MKKLLLALGLIISSLHAYSQNGYSSVFLRVTDSATFVNSANTVAKHAADYAEIWYSVSSGLFWEWDAGTSTYVILGSKASGGGGTWGSITGTLSNQTDLQTALNLKAPLASPTFTGTPTLPTGTIATTQTAGNSSTAVATTAFVTTADNLKANIASPTFTGTPAAPTASVATSTTQIATTAYVQTEKLLVANRQTSSYTLVLSDASKLVEMNVGTANDLTIPLNSSVAFAIGTQIPLVQYGIGLTTIVATGGVDIRSSSNSLVSPGQYVPMYLEKIATNEWYLWNGTSAEIVSGTYTPTLTNVANATASTAYLCTYLRVGNSVTVSGHVDIDPTVTLTSTIVGLSLPVASAFSTANQAGGTAAAPGFVSDVAAIMSDATNDRVQVEYICTDVTNHSYYFTFTYQVL